MSNPNDIMVTIRCIAYNQEKFIRQCLDGFVMQQTNFKFEAIVHDDASTDATADIIREYAERYPDIIKPILETENQYSQGSNKLRSILDPLMTGKYIAICEGDDYWTDPLKLQKQVDFLEAHPGYSMCFHQAIRTFVNDNRKDEPYSIVEDRDYTGLEMYQPQYRPATASIVFTSEMYRSDVYQKSLGYCLSFGDIPMFLCCAHIGKVRGMSDTMSVYRKHVQGLSNIFDRNDDLVLKFAQDNLALYKIFGNEYKEECTKVYVMDYFNFFMRNKKRGKYCWDILLKILFTHPIYTISFIIDRYKHRAK